MEENIATKKHGKMENIFFSECDMYTAKSIGTYIRIFPEFHVYIATQNANKEKTVFSLYYIFFLFPHLPLQ